MSNPLTVIIVEKFGTLKPLHIKVFDTEDLYKKCGFKKKEGFNMQTEWPVKMDGQKYIIQLYAKDEGKANMENKYDFPPPVDSKLFFGCCVLVGMIKDDDGNRSYINLTTFLWNKIYEKLFGGFEDLTNSVDDDEEDDLNMVQKHMKTANGGYLKDGFVVDSDNECDESSSDVSDDTTLTGSTSIDNCSELAEEEYI